MTFQFISQICFDRRITKNGLVVSIILQKKNGHAMRSVFVMSTVRKKFGT